MKCNKCYGEYDEGAKFCPHCGQPLTEAQPEAESVTVEPTAENNAPRYEAPPGYRCAQSVFSAPTGEMNTGLLIWSIVNTAVCCQILGIIALVLTVLAKGAASAEDEQKKLKTAKTLNLIGTVGGVLIFVLSIVFGIVFSIFETNYYW